MKGPVVVELNIRHMREQVAHAIMLREEEIRESVQAAVDEVLSTAMDEIQRHAQEKALECIRESITSYFKYGQGYKYVDSAVNEALDKLFK